MKIVDEDDIFDVVVAAELLVEILELVTEFEELEILLVELLLLVKTEVLEVLVADSETDEDFEVLERTVVDETAVELRAYN